MVKQESYSVSQSKKIGLDHIFPESSERKKMTLVFACLSCLICLMMIAVSAGLRAGDHWGSAFQRNYVLELRAIPEVTATEQIETAQTILRNDNNIQSFRVVGDTELQELMAPWLGDGLAISDLPLSQLIEIEMKDGNIKENLASLKAELIQIPGAAIEAYHEAKAEYKAAGHAVRLISFMSAIILVVVAAAVTAVSVESGVLDNKKIVGIMHLIGTENKMISELFIKKILTHAIKGALLGMVIAMAIVALISLIGALDGLGATFIFAQFIPGAEVLAFLVCVPLTILVVGYVAGKKTMDNLLTNFI